MLLKVNAGELQRKRESAQMTPYRLAKESGLPVNAIYRLSEISDRYLGSGIGNTYLRHSQ